MLPGTQGVDTFGALPIPPMTAGEVGTGPRTPGGVTLGLLVPGVALAPIDELPIADPGVVLNVPVIGCGPTPVVAPGVPIVLPPIDELPVTGRGVVPNTLGLPMLGLATLGAPPEPTTGAGLNAPVIGAAVCARHAGTAAIKAAAAAGAIDFRLSMRVSFEW